MTTPETIKVSQVAESDPITCPFCSFQIYPGDQVEGWVFEQSNGVCEHTLFFATDAGFEYRSPLFNQHMGLPNNQESEPEILKNDDGETVGYDAFTSKVSIPGAVKFASYAGAPSFFGAYYGFAPK